MRSRLRFFGLNAKASWLKNALVLLATAFAMLVPTEKAMAQCEYTLTLYGDEYYGWYNDGAGMNSYLTVYINGIQYGQPFTIPENYGNEYIANPILLNSGDTITFKFEGNDPENSENFIFTNCGGDIIYDPFGELPEGSYFPDDGPYPLESDSLIIASCAVLPSNCLGAVTVCKSTDVSNAISQVGCTPGFEFTNSDPGYISSTTPGTWYYFSPTTTGLLTFTITPTTPGHNYDFSLWGPYDQAQCPDNDLPIRSSVYLIAGTDNPGITGLDSASIDTLDLINSPGDGWAKALTIDSTKLHKVYALFIQLPAEHGQDFNLTIFGPELYCGLLPIELLSLQAQARGRVVDITWATATEQNSDHFDIQRSFDDSNYVTIGTLPAAGDAQFRTDYAFTDNTPGHGANYYRLREVDRDGAVTITHTVVALMDGDVQVPVLFPNPVTGILNVSFTAFKDGNAVLSIRDALGRTVKQQQSPVQRGQQTVRIPMDDLQQGCYSLQIDLPSGIAVRGGTFVKQ